MAKTTKTTKLKPAKKIGETREKLYFFKTPKGRLPSNIKELLRLDKELQGVSFGSLTRTHYITPDIGGSNCNLYNPISNIDSNSSRINNYSDLIDSLSNRLSSYTKWNEHSTFLRNIVLYKHVRCYTSFREDTVSDKVLSTTYLLSAILSDYYKDVVGKKRVHKQPLMNTCAWLARHLHRMVNKKVFGLLYSRRKGHYVSTIREDRERGHCGTPPSFNYLIDLIDALKYNDLIVNFLGYKLERLGDAEMSLLLPKGYLLSHIIDNKSESVDLGSIIGRSEVIIRDKDKNIVANESFDGIEDFIQSNTDLIYKFNTFLGDHTIEVDGVELPDLIFSRIFSNETIDDGGRLFDNGQWTTLPKDKRKLVTIDGEMIKTIDLKALHPSLLYRIEGIELTEDFDPYPKLVLDLNQRDINKFKKFYNLTTYNPVRNIAKVALLIMINSKSLDDAKKALRYKMLKDLSKGGTCREADMSFIGVQFKDVDSIFAQIAEHNKEISKHFYTGAAMKLMRTDSDIMTCAIRKLLAMSIVALPLHDSISVAESCLEDAGRVLKESYKEVLGDTTNYRVSIE